MDAIDDFKRSLQAGQLGEACRKAVDRLLPESREYRQTPDLLALCRMKNIAVSFEDDVPFEGRFHLDQGRARITIRRAKERKVFHERERFTLAHELGHWIFAQVIGHNNVASYRGLRHKAVDDEEFIANALAAEILMPQERLQAELATDESMLYRISRIVTSFKVSRTAAMQRLCDILEDDLLYITIVPALFDDVDSRAIIDDAWWFRPQRHPIRERDQVYFDSVYTFREAANARSQVKVVFYGGDELTPRFDTKCALGLMPQAQMLGTLG